MEEGDSHRRALGHVLGQTTALTEQLLSSVPERAADHARRGDEGRLDAIGALADDHQRDVPVDLALADHSPAPRARDAASASATNDSTKGSPPASSIATRAMTCCLVIVRCRRPLPMK